MSASFPYTGRRAARRVPFLLPFRSRQISSCPTEGRATRPRPFFKQTPLRWEKPKHYCSGSPTGFFRQSLYLPLLTRASGGGWVSLSIAQRPPIRTAARRPAGRCARPCRSAPPTALRSAVHPRRERLHAMSAAIPLTRPAQMKKIPRNVNTPFIFQTPFDLTFPHASVSLRRGRRSPRLPGDHFTIFARIRRIVPVIKSASIPIRIVSQSICLAGFFGLSCLPTFSPPL